MAARIKKITMKNFRGATQPVEIPVNVNDHQVIVLFYGENGTGKSTIVDAIDFICNESAGSLRERSSVSMGRHIPALGKKDTDVEVELVVGGVRWHGGLRGQKIGVRPVLGADDPVLASASQNVMRPPRASVLRRRRLLQLVEATPSERYAAMQSYVDIGNVEKAEKRLKEAVSAAKEREEKNLQKLATADKQLEDLWNLEGRAEANHIEWARERAAADQGRQQKMIMELEKLLALIEEWNRTAQMLAQEEIAAIDDQARLEQLNLELAGAEVSGETGGAALVQLLRDAQIVLTSYNRAECPLCQDPKDLAALAHEVGERLGRMAYLNDLLEQRRVAENVHQRHAAQVERARSNRERAGKSLAEFVERAAAIPSHILGNVGFGDLGPTPQSQEQLAAQLVSGSGALRQYLEGLKKDLHQFNAIVVQYRLWEESDTEKGVLHSNAECIKRAYELVIQKRLEYTQNVLVKVSTETQRLYEHIHPGEPIKLLEFVMDEGKRASLEQYGEFHGVTGVPPQAYFSESHLDTLAFALFVALAKLEGGTEAILVLDDVFTSVDGPHIARVFDVLTEEADAFSQIIVTTHSPYIRNLFASGYLPVKIYHAIDLGHWSLLGGIRPQNHVADLEKLRSLVDDTHIDRRNIAGLAGVLLEETLLMLAQQYDCSVAINQEGRYQLGTLLSGVSKAVSKIIVRKPDILSEGAVKYRELAPADIISKLRGLAFIRNQVGAHFNEEGNHVPDSDVKMFGQLTLELWDLLRCEQCSTIPKTSTGTYYRCKCKSPKPHTQMSPLEV